MKMRFFVFVFIFKLLIINNLKAQKIINTDEQTWLAVFNQARLSGKWGLWHDSHLRLRTDFVDSLSLGLMRLGLTYYINDDVRLTAGYAYIGIGPDGARRITQPEHRPWQQVQWFVKFPKLRLMQWLRLEQRFRRQVSGGTRLLDDYDYNGRLRHNALLTIPLSKKGFGKGGLQLAASNELFINFGKNIVFNVYDQNRFFLGLAYQNTAQSNIQFGYLNVFQQFATGNRFRNSHAFRLFYFHNFDFRRPKEGK